LRRRIRKQGLNDSFELFLDTITNTFGGVLLIALLIVLMIRESKDSAPNQKQSGATEDRSVVQSQISSLEAEKQSVQVDLEMILEFKQGFQSEELKKLTEELMRNAKNNSEQSLKFNALKDKLANSKNQHQNKKEEFENIGLLLKQQQTELEKVTKELKNEESRRTRTMALPKQKETSKEEVAIFLESDELFVLEDASARFGFRLNRMQFEKGSVSDADAQIAGEYYKTKSNSGLAIASQDTTAQLQKYDSSTQFFTFIVRSDTFDTFGLLRDHCVKHGYEYRVIPTDDMIVEGSSSATRTQSP
jgi:hypothetical protein